MTDHLKDLGISWPDSGMLLPEDDSPSGVFMDDAGGVRLDYLLLYCHRQFATENFPRSEFIHMCSVYIAALIQHGELVVPDDRTDCPQVVAYYVSHTTQALANHMIKNTPCACAKRKGGAA